MIDLFKLYSGTVFISHSFHQKTHLQCLTQAHAPQPRQPYLSSLFQAHCKLTCVYRFACDGLSKFPLVSCLRQGLSQHSAHLPHHPVPRDSITNLEDYPSRTLFFPSKNERDGIQALFYSKESTLKTSPN